MLITLIKVLTVYAWIYLQPTAFVNAATCPSSTQSLVASSTVQTISSPNYDSAYGNREHCDWAIDAGSSKVVYAYLNFISLEWNYDFLNIYNSQYASNNIFYSRNSRTGPRSVVSTAKDMFVRFTSDYSITYTGFELEYIAISDSATTCDQATTVTATTTEQELYNTDYSRTCSFTITASAGSYIEIEVPIVDNQVTVAFSGTTYSIYTAGTQLYGSNSIEIALVHESVVRYKSVASSSPVTVATAAQTTTATPSLDICSNTFAYATSQVQYITSSNYPRSYDNNKYCTLQILASTSTEAVRLEVLDFELDWTNDYLKVYDGPNSGSTLLDSVTVYPQTFTSTGEYLSLIFFANYYASARGFRLSFTTTAQALVSCASSYTIYDATEVPQYIESINYPSPYTNSHSQYWLIRKPNSTAEIIFNFQSFSVEDSSSCHYDALIIFEGPCTTYTQLKKLCGSISKLQRNGNQYIVEYSSLYYLVYFITDGSVTNTGFRIAYYIGANNAAYTGSSAASTSEDGDSSNLGIIIGAVIGSIVAIFILAFIVTVLNNRSKVKNRVSQGTGVAKSIPPMKKQTTGQLLHDMKKKSEEPKVPKKKKPPPPPFPPMPHPQPNPPGPNVNIISSGHFPGPHPAPMPPPLYPPMPGPNFTDAAYPPGYQPTAPLMNASSLPPPFSYVSPAEAMTLNQAGR